MSIPRQRPVPAFATGPGERTRRRAACSPIDLPRFCIFACRSGSGVGSAGSGGSNGGGHCRQPDDLVNGLHAAAPAAVVVRMAVRSTTPRSVRKAEGRRRAVEATGIRSDVDEGVFPVGALHGDRASPRQRPTFRSSLHLSTPSPRFRISVRGRCDGKVGPRRASSNVTLALSLVN